MEKCLFSPSLQREDNRQRGDTTVPKSIKAYRKTVEQSPMRSSFRLCERFG
jgi:hypothetical protein